MAIDNEDKRRSAVSHITLVILPVPDDDVDEGDRAQAAGVYRDFDFDEPSSGGGKAGGRLIIGVLG